jgi:hypothetical protein
MKRTTISCSQFLRGQEKMANIKSHSLNKHHRPCPKSSLIFYGPHTLVLAELAWWSA